jgi:hypothetical protein
MDSTQLKELQCTTVKDHEKRISELERADVKLFAKIDKLIENIQGLTSIVKWLLGGLGTIVIGFIAWAIQYILTH